MKEKSKQAFPVQSLFPVVGVGASAGGIKAFHELLAAIPQNSGMAYVLLQHLSPTHESILTEILQKATKLPVIEISDGIEVNPDHIYVLPANRLVTAADGVLRLQMQVKGEKLNTIDLFFSSLAEVYQNYAIGVVLSGTGSDGTVGLKTIRDQGGITIAQDEATATHFGMPDSAIKADVATYILPPASIPQRLIELTRQANITAIDAGIPAEKNEAAVFRQILFILRTMKGVDFTHYKQSTIQRRILRRLVLNNIRKLDDYATLLMESEIEQEGLFNEILIPVTAFFRDPKSFTLLYDEVFPKLFAEKNISDPLRIWVAGCSTGEEAYSLAICLQEYCDDRKIFNPIQIFATDISSESIAKARGGLYQKKDLAGVSESRTRNFFTKTDTGYRVNKNIRDMVVFAVQNFLTDPPFSRIDLVSCRNVLIYLQPFLQKKALTTFHFALKKNGFLLLGKSETPGMDTVLFSTVNKTEKLYKPNPAGVKKFPNIQGPKKGENKKESIHAEQRSAKDDLQKASDDAILAARPVNGVLVNEQLEILHFRGSTGDYLEPPPGKASHQLLKMARHGLAFELRNALHKAKQERIAVRKENIPLEKTGRRVNIEVLPVEHPAEQYFLVLFSDSIAPTIPEAPASGHPPELEEATHRVLQLEMELAQLRKDIHAIIEEQEAVNEELQTANEELLSGSEELQSLNEELETSKEEIQSSNEELTTLNQELIERNVQLVQMRKYAEAIVTTIHEPLIILTSDFYIQSANPSFYKHFSLTEQQAAGKPFFEISNGLWNIPGLRLLLEKILPEQSRFDKFEVIVHLPNQSAITYLLNARQLVIENTNEQLILLALQDITDQKLFENKLEKEVQERTAALREANIELLQLNENLQQFASIASHDLQEPLRKMKTFAALLRERHSGKIPDEGKELISKINISAERMSQLIKTLLTYSRLSNSAREFTMTDLDAVLKTVIADLDLLLEESGGIIQVGQQLPQIRAIPLQIHQLFHNLLTNALKFQTPGSSPAIDITCRPFLPDEAEKSGRLLPEAAYIEIIISDNGIGFEQQFADQIFQIFERLHASDEFEGTGIGLALCKKIVENHHGDIFARSVEGEGASFHIILPASQPNH